MSISKEVIYNNLRLAIAIPTYNRATILEENLIYILPEIERYQIPIYISDDSTNEETKTMVEKISKKYNNIFYRHNEKPLGHDLNCIATLSWPNEEYIWYLGDSIIIHTGTIKRILDAIIIKPDFVFLNSWLNKHIYHSGIIQNNEAFLVNYLWYLTMTGATVYSKKTLYKIRNEKKFKIYDNFMQLGIILEWVEKNNCQFFWIDDQNFYVNPKKKSYWGSNALKVFCHDWILLIESFPTIIKSDVKEKIIKSHSANTKLFSIKNLFVFRANGALTWKNFFIYRSDYKKSSHLPLFFSYIFLLFPRFIFIGIKALFNKIKELNN